ncbi:MAG: prepilin-type N-terminal cleavage/methylation domain-containing protein [Litorimonas sp.]
MPISATGSRHAAPRRDDGFSLVELLAVLAILSLMVGAVVLNLPAPRSAADRQSEALAAQLSRFVDDGAVAGEMRALELDPEGLSLLRHDGLAWQDMAETPWPDAVRIRLERDGDPVDLSEAEQSRLLFEPYGAVPDFALVLAGRDADYVLSADERGRIRREVRP